VDAQRYRCFKAQALLSLPGEKVFASSDHFMINRRTRQLWMKSGTRNAASALADMPVVTVCRA
jgi:hypothetical protein